MKALTLTQPWATLVAVGAKRIETRSFRTHYRGPLAIHAAKGFPRDARDFATCQGVRKILAEHFGDSHFSADAYPLGCVLATTTLIGCRFTEDIVGQISEQEEDFGDYSAGRYAWFLSDLIALPEPIPAKGALGLWEWTAHATSAPHSSTPEVKA